MIISDPNQQVDIPVRMSMPEGQRPSVKVWALNRSEKKKGTMIFDDIPGSTGPEIFDAMGNFVLKQTVTWSGFKDRKGNEIKFDGELDTLDLAMSDQELMDLFTVIMFTSQLTGDDAKKSESLSDTNTDRLEEDAAADETPNASTVQPPLNPSDLTAPVVQPGDANIAKTEE